MKPSERIEEIIQEYRIKGREFNITVAGHYGDPRMDVGTWLLSAIIDYLDEKERSKEWLVLDLK